MIPTADNNERLRDGKSREAFRTISEVADELDLPQHVLRFWESKFSQVKPLKRGGNRRYYRPEDIVLLRAIRHLLHAEGYTIRGVQKLFKEQGVKATISHALGDPQEQIGTTPVPKGEDAVAEPSPVQQSSGDENIQNEYKFILEELKTIRSILS